MNSARGSTESASSSEALLIVGANWIGDAVMSMPALQAWRRAHPSVRLILVAKSHVAPLWSMHAAPDEVLTFHDSILSMRGVAREIARRGVTRAVVLPNSFRSAMLACWAGVPERIGRAGHARRWLLTRVVPDPGPGHQSLETYDLLSLPRPADGPERPCLQIPQEARASAQRAVSRLPRPLLGILPGAARGPAKRWPAHHFARIAVRWHVDTGGGVIAMGSAADRELGEQALIGLEESLNFAGQTTLVEWAALLSICDAVVCNDSGGMHVAAALERPVVAVFGATDPAVTGPIGPRVRVVTDEGPRARAIPRSDAEAELRLAAIAPERVYAALREVAL